MKRDCFSDVVASSCFRFLELELPPLAFVLDEVDAEEVEFEFVKSTVVGGVDSVLVAVVGDIFFFFFLFDFG